MSFLKCLLSERVRHILPDFNHIKYSEQTKTQKQKVNYGFSVCVPSWRISIGMKELF